MLIACKGSLISLGDILAFNSYQFLGKLQLHFKCICSTSPNDSSSSKVCNPILSFVLLSTNCYFLPPMCV